MTEQKKDQSHCPTMSGSMSAYHPQWKNRGTWGEVVNKRLGLENGGNWQNVAFITIRGGIGFRLPDGREVALGVPFPRCQPGVYETIGLCGYEQAMALAWSFAAWVASAGGEIDVRAQKYDLNYDIKAKVVEESEPQSDTER